MTSKKTKTLKKRKCKKCKKYFIPSRKNHLLYCSKKCNGDYNMSRRYWNRKDKCPLCGNIKSEKARRCFACYTKKKRGQLSHLYDKDLNPR